MQYDALINKEYRDLIQEYADMLDIGVWLETVRPLCEKAEVKYNGRKGWDWDYHSNASFLIGYEPQERYKLLDTVFSDFKKYFGYYPNVAGSWVLDAVSLKYMKEKYSICCAVNCVEQMGIDGYTLWGGYPAGGYYPSVENSLCPANDESKQIKVPVFRFSGQDGTHYYGGTHIYTLEPAALDAGGNEAWASWYISQILSSPSLSFSYLQTGQENSFGWERLGKGFEMQCRMIAEMQRVGKIKLQTMKETGEEFIKHFSVTPATAKCAFRDWSEEGKQSVWYMSRFYRAGMIADEKGVRFRDIFLFDQNFQERYLQEKETTRSCFFTNLEVFSGLTRKDGREPAIYVEDGETSGRVTVSGRESAQNTLEISSSNGFKFVFEETKITISANDKRAFKLRFLFRDPPEFAQDNHEGIDYDAARRLFNPPSYTAENGKILFQLERDGKTFAYEAGVLNGKISETSDGLEISVSAGDSLTISLSEPGRYI